MPFGYSVYPWSEPGTVFLTLKYFVFPLTPYIYLLSFLSSLRGGLTEGEVRQSNLLDYRGDCFALAGLAMTLMPNTLFFPLTE